MKSEKKPTRSPQHGTQSIERAVSLLRELAMVNRTGASVSQLALAAGIDRATAYRMLRCMAAESLLSYSESMRKYFLGPLAFELGSAAADRMELRAVCRPALLQIAQQSGDTAFLIARTGFDSVCLDRVEGSYPVKTFVVDVGTRRPLGLGAGGVAMLSAMPPAEAASLIKHNEARLAAMDGAFEAISARRLLSLVARVRAKNGAASYVLKLTGVCSLAVPLLTPQGRPIASLSVAAIKSRMSAARQAELFEILAREAKGLSGLLDAAMV